jgi:hypothetical protein
MNTNRISISEKDSSTSILIISKKDKIKQQILLSWIILWSIGGAIVFTQLFRGVNNQERLFLIIWLVFWLYFELITLNAYLWRRFGLERLLVKEGKLYYKKEIKNKGKQHCYDFQDINNLKIIDESKENSFVKNIKESYWVIGGETISFDYVNQTVKLGLQLEKAETQKLFNLLEKKIKRSSK